MSSIEITSRFRTIINRAIEMKWKKFVEFGEKTRHSKKLLDQYGNDDDEPCFTLHYEGLYLVFEYDMQKYHSCNNYNDDDLNIYQHDCSCEKEVKYEIYITNKKGSPLYHTRLFSREFTLNHTLEQVLLEYVFLPESIDICQCGDVAAKDKWCSDCYIWRTEHPTDAFCPVCHENEGQYIVTECSHYFHEHCWGQLEFVKGKGTAKKCPLCRKVTDSKTYRG